ncbi:hypothetical protein BSKO_08742 [Bryopsis sp. KO-2023]|nr:hypothetical protein BSKO_08742 [Bryopsis sp. KO-2023]
MMPRDGSPSAVKRVHVYDLSRDVLRRADKQQVANLKSGEGQERRLRSTERESAKYRIVHTPTRVLNSGKEIPLIGLGTWKSATGEVRTAVREAIECGYRHIDCAEYYGNEKEVGEALKAVFSAGVVKREELFVTSKLWNTNHGEDRVRPACVNILKDLGLKYLDLLLIHWPVTGNSGDVLKPSTGETWQAMEKLVNEGLVSSIGVSNFSIKKIKDILELCRIKPAVSQVEVHPYFRNDEMIEWCKAQDIHVTAYAPLGSPDSANLLKRKLTPSLLTDPTAERIAKRMNKNVGQVLIKWGLQHGTSVLPKSVRSERIKSNLDVLDWDLASEDYHELSSFRSQLRMVDGSVWISSSGPYRSLSELWDDPAENDRFSNFIRSQYESSTLAPAVSISAGIEMPVVGLGTWRSEPGEVQRSVLAAVRAGYRHIDCAEVYGNESEVGEALEQVFTEGVVSRKELWVTSKLWNTNHGKRKVKPAVQKTLKDLRLDYLDLYLIHWPVSGNLGPTLQPSLEETWSAMESLVDDGLVRAIGVSNFSGTKLKDLLETARIKPAVNQVEAHPYFRSDGLFDFCKSRGIHMTAYSPLGGAPDNESLAKRKLPKLMQDPFLNELSRKLDKSAAQILIRWAVQRGTSVLPKSTNPARIKVREAPPCTGLRHQQGQRDI